MRKLCIGCDESKRIEYFYREQDSRCKECTNQYQKDRRKKIKEERQTVDVASKIIDRFFEDKGYDETLSKLQEISDKLDQLLLSKNGPSKPSFSRK